MRPGMAAARTIEAALGGGAGPVEGLEGRAASRADDAYDADSWLAAARVTAAGAFSATDPAGYRTTQRALRAVPEARG